jgi:Fic family protein
VRILAETIKAIPGSRQNDSVYSKVVTFFRLVPKTKEQVAMAHRMMKNGKVPAVIHAAAISYGFVFMHPFEDGNGSHISAF